MADYPANFAGILEAVAGGINSFMRTRNELQVYQQERARQEANDAAQRQFQAAQIGLERERNQLEGRRVAEEEATGKLQRSDYVRKLEDDLRNAGFDERETKAIMAEMEANFAGRFAGMEREKLNIEEQLYNAMREAGGGVGPDGKPIPGLAGMPASVRDNYMQTLSDELDRIAANSPNDPVLQEEISRLKIMLPFKVASGTFTEEDAAKMLDALYPKAAATSAGDKGEKKAGKSSSFGRTRFGMGTKAVGGAVGKGVMGAGEIIPAPFGGLIPAAQWLFAPVPEKVAGAHAETKNLTQPLQRPVGPEPSPALKALKEKQQRRLAATRMQ